MYQVKNWVSLCLELKATRQPTRFLLIITAALIRQRSSSHHYGPLQYTWDARHKNVSTCHRPPKVFRLGALDNHHDSRCNVTIAMGGIRWRHYSMAWPNGENWALRQHHKYNQC